MAIDVKKLRPTELCRLLNSTPLGEVINRPKLQRHRERAGLRIGSDRYVDLFRYIAWLVQVRHAPEQPSANGATMAADLDEAARGAAELACRQPLMGHGQKFTRKHEDLIAALLTEPTYAKAAKKAGVSKATLNRWLRLPEFQAAYRRACRALLEASVGRMQAASGLLVDSLIKVALNGRRDSDRTRAALGLLDRGRRGLPSVEALHGMAEDSDALLQGTSGLVTRLESLLRQVDQSDLSLAEKARLTAMLTDPLLRAYKEDELAQRLEAVEAVLQNRKEKVP